MKINTLLLLPVAVASAGVVKRDGAFTEKELLEQLKGLNLMNRASFRNGVANAEKNLEKRQFPNLFGGAKAPAAAAAAPPSNAPKSGVPEVQIITPSFLPGATRKKIRYGPYKLPSTKETNVESVVMGVAGMSDNFAIPAKKPCDTCTLLSVESSLEYANGSIANTDTGSWLHHVVLVNAGPNVKDVMCGLGGKASAIFMDGNERTPNRYWDGDANQKTGNHLTPDDTFVIVNELMNMDPVEKWVWNTLTYEYIEGEHPDYRQTANLFLSIGPSCQGFVNPAGPSNLTITSQPKPGSKAFSEMSIPWKSPVDGVILGAGGHLHDGGTDVVIYHNDKVICDSIASYGGAGSVSGMGMSANDGMEHIGEIKACNNLGPIAKGDTIKIQAKYDFTKHAGMKNKKGDLDEVMGMAGVLLAI